MMDRHSEKVTSSPLSTTVSPSARQALHFHWKFWICRTKRLFTYDLESNFDCTAWRTFMERRGAVVLAVPADSHWVNAAEKPIELVRHKLKYVGTSTQVSYSRLLYVSLLCSLTQYSEKCISRLVSKLITACDQINSKFD